MTTNNNDDVFLHSSVKKLPEFGAQAAHLSCAQVFSLAKTTSATILRQPSGVTMTVFSRLSFFRLRACIKIGRRCHTWITSYGKRRNDDREQVWSMHSAAVRRFHVWQCRLCCAANGTGEKITKQNKTKQGGIEVAVATRSVGGWFVAGSRSRLLRRGQDSASSLLTSQDPLFLFLCYLLLIIHQI